MLGWRLVATDSDPAPAHAVELLSADSKRDDSPPAGMSGLGSRPAPEASSERPRQPGPVDADVPPSKTAADDEPGPGALSARPRTHTLALRSAKHGGAIGGGIVKALCTEEGDLLEIRADASGNVKVPASKAVHYYVSAPGHGPKSVTPINDEASQNAGTTVVRLVPFAEVSGSLDPARFAGASVSLHPLALDGQPLTERISPHRTALVDEQGIWRMERLLPRQPMPDGLMRASIGHDASSHHRYSVTLKVDDYERTMFPSIEVAMGEVLRLEDPFHSDISATIHLVYPSGRSPTTSLKAVLSRADAEADVSIAASTDPEGNLELPAIGAGRWTLTLGSAGPYPVDLRPSRTTTVVLEGLDCITGQVRWSEGGSIGPGMQAMVQLSHVGSASRPEGAAVTMRQTDGTGRFSLDLVPADCSVTLKAQLPRRQSRLQGMPVHARGGDQGVTLILSPAPEVEPEDEPEEKSGIEPSLFLRIPR